MVRKKILKVETKCFEGMRHDDFQWHNSMRQLRILAYCGENLPHPRITYRLTEF